MRAFLVASVVFLASMVRAQTPHPNAHSHNDYFRVHPVADALANGFGSIEADIHLVDGRLLVAHDRARVSAAKDLESMYLAPLRERCRANGGQVYRGGKNDFHLLVDIKADPDGTYAVLGPLLAKYRDILTRFTDADTTPGAVTAILSGARPTARVAAERERWCGIDGRLPDLDGNPSPHLVPWMSDSWRPTFGGLRDGRLSDVDRAKLRAITANAHAQGRKVRFWDAPDRPDMWKELRDGGVDILNADDLPALAAFLDGKPAPRKSRSAEE
ncbi:MAG: hypothetical protein DVB31_09440 [Verrucomicrobia bacterium]|nr:MAG: hypothetical protein DVB31_09440 [Verrucomicrobiota bacterium]